MHIIEVSFYYHIESNKKIEVSEIELNHLRENKTLSSNIEMEKSIMTRLTGVYFNNKKTAILKIEDVKILVSIY